MRTFVVLILFVSLLFAFKLINGSEQEEDKNKEDVQLIFSKIYKHRFDTL